MKRITPVYLATACFFLATSAHAGRYFNVSQDSNNSRTVHFKKSGKKFNTALNELAHFSKGHKIHRVTFEENVSEKQKETVFQMLNIYGDLLHLGDGALVTKDEYRNAKIYLTSKKTAGRTYQSHQELDLQFITHSMAIKFLPFANQVVEDMNKITCLHFSLADMNNDLLKALTSLLHDNQTVKHVFFQGEGRGRGNQVTLFQVLPDLLYVPGDRNYYFSYKLLRELSSEFLEKEGLNAEWVHTYSGKKAVMPLISDYVTYWDSNNPYRIICTSPIYSPLFKASYTNYVNEKEQTNCLMEMLQEVCTLATQHKNIQTILRKEEQPYKPFPMYKDGFVEIQKLLIAQSDIVKKGNENFKDDYENFEAQKRERIQEILKHMWGNTL